MAQIIWKSDLYKLHINTGNLKKTLRADTRGKLKSGQILMPRSSGACPEGVKLKKHLVKLWNNTLRLTGINTLNKTISKT